MPSASHLDVRGLQIAMDDPLLVRRFERLRDLLRDRQRLVEWNRAARDALGERRPLDQFHHERRAHRLLFSEAVDGRDVGMIQRGEDLRFALEPREALGVSRKRSGSTLMATSRFSVVSARARPRPCRPRRSGQ